MTYIPQEERRVFSPQREAQGFRSQAHLDAWYRAFDHTRACPAGVCGTPGPSAWLEGDASWQPTVRECEEARRLHAEASQTDRPLRGDLRLWAR
jgi:hypothetical protein